MCSQQLRQEVKTSLKLNAALTQSIKTLQLSSQELDKYINSELLDNPFLVKEELYEEDTNQRLYTKKISTKHYDYNNYDMIDNIESEIGLKEHILRQINCIGFDDTEKFIASYLTDFLDENAYLQIGIDEVSKNLKVSTKKTESILSRLQSLDPSGVFARDLRECLTLQLKDLGKYSINHAKILDNLELVAKKDLAKLSKICSVTIDQTKELIQSLLKLDPKPGRNFSPKNVSVKIPDVNILLNEEGNIIISSNKEIFLSIFANKEYYDNIKNKSLSEEEKRFITEKFKLALNISKSVEARGKTINLVASAIAHEQEDFFKRGILYLKPLTLAKIAELTGYDESTISRATSNKYVGTPYGVLEMKYFFSSALKSKYSKEEVSSHKVKELIKTLISNEEPNSPLSDEEIALMLKQFNVVVARRTVSKYRESLNLEPSSKRKRTYCMSY